MLDRIQNNSLDNINQSQNLEKIEKYGSTNPIKEDRKSFFIDESQISQRALEKYQRELDITKFSDILKQTSQKEADDLVMSKAFNGSLSVENDDWLSELINSKDFLDDILSEFNRKA